MLTCRYLSAFWRNICLNLQGGRRQASQSHIIERGSFHSRCLWGFQTVIIDDLYCILHCTICTYYNNMTIVFGMFLGTELYLLRRRCYRCPAVVAMLYSTREVSLWARYSVAAPCQKAFNSRFPRSPKSLSQTPKQEADARQNLNPSETVL